MKDDDGAVRLPALQHQTRVGRHLRQRKAFGGGAMEILGISGCYSLVSMVLNTAKVELPAGTPPFAMMLAPVVIAGGRQSINERWTRGSSPRVTPRCGNPSHQSAIRDHLPIHERPPSI